MTETNQHGGAPTCWNRQDTFHGSLWWSGTCLASLRGGMEILQYYKLVDDPPGSYNYKGLLFNDAPYNPPLFPGGPPHGKKPVYETAHFINNHRLDTVIESGCNHPEISHLVTLHPDHSGLTILLANLFKRTIMTDIQIILPGDMHDGHYMMRSYSLDNTGPGFTICPSITPGAGKLGFTWPAAPETIYAVELQREPGSVYVIHPVSGFACYLLTSLSLLLLLFIRR